MKKLLLILLCLPMISFGQNWVDMMQDPNVNFYETQRAFNNFWENKDIEKGKGWKQFKRWENFMEARVYPDGIIQTERLYEEYLNLERENSNFRLLPPNIWTQVGPDDVPLEGSGRKRGIGRLNAIVFHPYNADKLYVGAPAGGFWKSDDAGQNWTTSTDFLTNVGVSDIAIHPNNPDTLFVITGDRDAGDTYSYGVMKSFDGGNSWQTTGLSFNITSLYRGNRILIDPINPNILVVATSNGVYRSTDLGDNFTLTFSSANLVSMEFHPLNSDIIYAGSKGSTSVYKSIDNGVTWQQSGTGLPVTSNVSRACIAVTNDNSNVVYALFGNNDNGFYALYKSSDEGNTWSQQSNSPNLLGWSTNGSDTGGQAWYDLALTVSPLDENIVFVGGVNCWKSNDSGVNWTLNTHWYGGGGANYMHADEHMLQYNTLDNKVYSANDGGLYVSADQGNSWTDISDGLQITQFYKLGVSQTVQNLVIGGTQDNGTFLKDQNNWDAVIGGDGMECIIDYTDENIMYGSVYYGDIRKSTNGGNSFSSIAPSNNGAWVTPYILDKTDPNTIYIGYDELYKSNDGGSSWSIITNGETSGGRIDQIDISKSNSNIILFSDNSSLYKTDDGGLSWLDISSLLPNKSITGIAIHPTDPNRLWLSFSGYSPNEKVYFSDDGGSTWTNISGTLPNIPANCIIINELDSLETVYLGTDLGVFTKDSTSLNWNNLNSGTLPNVIVSELEIQYSSNKLFAATFGRGLWSFDLQITTPPIANFSVDDSVFCSVPASVNFTNNSFYSTSYFWDFGDGNTSTSTNPSHTYLNYGNYSVSLIATGPLGVDTIVYPSLINISTSNSCIVTLPSSGQGNTQTSCNGKLYDVGGPNGNYYDNCDSWITIEPSGANQVTLNFLDFDIEAPSGGLSYCNWDYLEIFDGNSTSSPSLGQYCNTLTGSPGTISSSGGAITILLHADQSVNGRGFEVDWSCSYPINLKTYVPDDNFENYLEANGMGDGIPLNDSVLTANISNINNLSVNNLSISDLSGIEDFTALTSLTCQWNSLSNLDLSQNVLLTHLDCHQNQISFLDITQNIALSSLNISANQLQSIDVSQNLALINLVFEFNQVDSLDISQNILLTELNCRYNQIPSLDVTQNTSLSILRCHDNQIPFLDLTQNLLLILLDCGSNLLSNLDVSQNTVLEYLNCNSNSLQSLDLSQNIALTTLEFSGNQILSIDLTQNSALIDLSCAFNQLTILDITQNINLTGLNCNNNQLISLDVSNGNNFNFTYFNSNYNPNLTCINVDDSTYSANNWLNIDPNSYFSNNCSLFLGCTDSSALNYDSLATNDNCSCVPFIFGCTSPNAINWWGGANTDDGTCIYVGCTDPNACNYNPLATIDDSSCFYGVCGGPSGCIDPLATNFNSLATIDDGSCVYCIYGCIDPLASNFNPLATCDDGSCSSPIWGCTYSLSSNYNPFATLDDGSCIISNHIISLDSAIILPSPSPSDCFRDIEVFVSNNDTLGSQSNCEYYYNLKIFKYDNGQFYSYSSSLLTNGNNYSVNNLDEGTYYIMLVDSVAFGNNLPFQYFSSFFGTSWSTVIYHPSVYDFETIVINTNSGCTDSTALNYDSLAICDDGSCIQIIYGCTDSSAINYFAGANVDNGSCSYSLFDSVYISIPIECHGNCDGEITVVTNSNVNVWFDVLIYVPANNTFVTYQPPGYGSTTFTIGNLCSAQYRIRLLDFSSGSILEIFDKNITEPNPINISSSTIDASCYGGNDGAVLLFISGGTIPYSYNWSTSDTTPFIDSLTAGLYTVIVDDVNNCYGLPLSFIISEPQYPLSVYGTITNTSTIFTNDGSVSLNTQGGTPQYSYLWSTGDTTSFIDSLSIGLISCTVSDANGCNYLWSYVMTFDTIFGCTDPLAINYDSLANADDGSCSYSGCTDSLALNFNSLALTDDGSCIYYTCQEPAPINLYSNNITDIKATINWDNMNSADCKVLKYLIRYREVGTNNWITKSGGVGNGLCNFGINTTSKLLQNLSPSTTYQYKMKAFYCYGGGSTWSLPKYFTTEDICPPMSNLSAQTYSGNPSKVTFSWNSTGNYVFARIALRVNNPGTSWQTAGGFGVFYPTLFVNKFGLQPGTDYRGQGRTFCDSNITSYRSWWTAPILWTQPNNRLIGGNSISNLEVYPNPSDQFFNISFNSDIIQELNIRVLNSLGQVIFNDFKNQFVGEYTKQLNLENYRQGVYLLEIQTDEDLVYKKIILK